MKQRNRWSSMSVTGMFFHFWLKIRGKTLLLTGCCNGCGNCCKRLSLEGNDGWLRSEEKFYNIVREFPEYQRFSIIGKDGQGFLLFSCSWCSPEGLCSDYDRRLPMCRNFPEKSLLFSGGSLPEGCGYNYTTVKPFGKVLAEQLKKKQP